MTKAEILAELLGIERVQELIREMIVKDLLSTILTLEDVPLPINCSVFTIVTDGIPSDTRPIAQVSHVSVTVSYNRAATAAIQKTLKGKGELMTWDLDGGATNAKGPVN